MAVIPGTQQDINQKTALQTTITPVQCTGVCNLVNFGPQMAKNSTGVLTCQKSTFLAAHILGDKWRFLLKI